VKSDKQPISAVIPPEDDVTRKVSQFSPERLRFLARALKEKASGSPSSFDGGMRPLPLVPISTAGANPPLFMVHPVGGGVLAYNDLARHLSREQPVYALQNHEVGGDQAQRDSSIEQMATRYIDAIQTVQAHGPYYVGGSSMGGTIAMEIAQQFTARKERVALVALLDTPGQVIPRLKVQSARLALAVDGVLLGSIIASGQGKEAVVSMGEIENVLSESQLAFTFQKLQEHALVPLNLDLATFEAALATFRKNLDAMEQYQPRPYSGKVLMLRASEVSEVMKGTAGAICDDPTFGWQAHCTQPLLVEFVPGDHARMNLEPAVQVVGAALQRHIDNVRGLQA
jgi:thioesterase domain-containing protein